jgi:NAD(P)-dependent dehydrogenase (short-subunit alcohol dehydrogenase family)
MKQVLVTGATAGIGRAIAEAFLAAGAHVYGVARRPVEGPKGMDLLLEDLCAPGAADRLADALPNRVDAVVLNAGAYAPGPLLGSAPEQLDSLWDLNVASGHRVLRALADRIPRGGHVFVIASVASRKMFPDKMAYSVTKSAQLAYAEGLRQELRPRGIRVTAVLPGPTWSASWEGVELPADRLLRAEDVAAVVLAAWNLPPNAVVEEVVIRPMEGDLDAAI